MASREDLMTLARQKREAAARVRRVARMLSLYDDRWRLLRDADELDARAGDLERQANDNTPSADRPGPPQPAQQEQVQQQQQHQAGSETGTEPKSQVGQTDDE